MAEGQESSRFGVSPLRMGSDDVIAPPLSSKKIKLHAYVECFGAFSVVYTSMTFTQ